MLFEAFNFQGIAIKIDLHDLYALADSKRWKSSEIDKIKVDLLGRYYKRELENASNRAFDRQTSPGGRPWLPRSTKYAKQLNRRRLGRKLLAVTLHLKNSRQYQVSGGSAKYGSSIKYARIHQLGGKTGRQHPRQTLPRLRRLRQKKSSSLSLKNSCAAISDNNKKAPSILLRGPFCYDISLSAAF